MKLICVDLTCNFYRCVDVTMAISNQFPTEKLLVDNLQTYSLSNEAKTNDQDDLFPSNSSRNKTTD